MSIEAKWGEVLIGREGGPGEQERICWTSYRDIELECED